MTFLSDLVTQASNKGIGVVLYSGNDDARVSHFSTEVVIQVCLHRRCFLRERFSDLGWTDYRTPRSGARKVSVDGHLHLGTTTKVNLPVSFTKSAIGRTSSLQAVVIWYLRTTLLV